jgi:NAD(P)-dependent dehydrogenase (short-subunit alcohol dehydrogenase family)
MRLEAGQVAVVTGAASGIGRGLAEGLLRRGLAVVAADIEADALDRAVDEMATTGRVIGQVTDVGDPEALQRLATRTLDELGRVDVVCNNAGVVTPRLPVWEQSPEDWRWTLEVNLIGVVNGIRAFVPHLIRQGSGHVVNTASFAGLAPIPGGGNGAYTASKHAVVGLSETLVEELATVGVDVGVTVLCPGPVPSRIHSAERNRPAGLVAMASDAGSLPPPDFRLTLEPVDATTVADQLCAAIEAGRRYVLPGPGTPEMARRRIDGVLVDLG